MLVALALAALATPANAAGSREEAKAHHELGRIEFGKGNYAEALAEFRKAYGIAPIPDLLYNIGRCQEELHDVDGAVNSYEQYLAAKPNAEERAELEAKIAVLRHRPAAAHPEPPTLAPKPSTTAPAASSAALTASGPVRGERAPIYRRWWFWTGVTLVAAGAAVGLGVGLTVGTSPPRLGFPGTTVQ
jgi:tetratricopeptide (TPR) repeat protein